MTLLKTARHVGLKPKTSTKRQKYILQPPSSGSVSGRSASLNRGQDGLRGGGDQDDISVDDVPIMHPAGVMIFFLLTSVNLLDLTCLNLS